MDIKETMCKILTNRKKDLGWSYDYLSDETGISKSQLSYVFCHGGKGVSLDNIEVLAEVMGIEFELHEVFLPDR